MRPLGGLHRTERPNASCDPAASDRRHPTSAGHKPIAGAPDGRCSQPARGFLPRRLSDAGRAPGPTIVDGRHLKPFTQAATRRRPAEMQFRFRCYRTPDFRRLTKDENRPVRARSSTYQEFATGPTRSNRRVLAPRRREEHEALVGPGSPPRTRPSSRKGSAGPASRARCRRPSAPTACAAAVTSVRPRPTSSRSSRRLRSSSAASPTGSQDRRPLKPGNPPSSAS